MNECDEDDDRLYVWRCRADLALQSSAILHEIAIKNVAIGNDHCMLLTSNGQLYAYGNNEFGQLGQGHLDVIDGEPCLITALVDETITEVACGGRHTCAVTQAGRVYCWGSNDSKQCARQHEERMSTPALTEIQTCAHSTPFITSVSCGSVHTLALDGQGQIWSWGSGCQLGLPNVKQTYTPRLIEHLAGRRVLSISCGDEHNVILVEKMADAQANVHVHETLPSTCKNCNQDIYSMVEQNDVCIISDEHKCPLGLDVSQDTSTSLDDDSVEVAVECRPRANTRSICHLVDEDEAKRFLERQLSGEFLRGQQSALREKMSGLWGSVLLTGSHGLGSVGTGITNNVSTGITTVTSMTSRVVNNIRGTLEDRFGRAQLSIEGQTTDSTNYAESTFHAANQPTSKNDLEISTDISDSGVYPSFAAFHRSRSVGSLHTVMSRDDSWTCPPKSPVNHFDIELTEVSKRDVANDTPNSDEESDKILETLVRKPYGDDDSFPTKFSQRSFAIQRRTQFSSSSRTLSTEGMTRLGSAEKLQRRNSSDAAASTRSSRTHLSEEMDSILTDECDILHAVTDTEVWSWGKGRTGQLGHGDMLERVHPCCVRMLCNKGIVKVSAGMNHCLALSVGSQVYSWGDNTYYQLGHKETPSTCPHLVQCLAGTGLVWDLAAGQRESLLVAYFGSPQPEICFCGIRDRCITGLLSDTKMGSQTALYFPERLSQLKKNGWVKRCATSAWLCTTVVERRSATGLTSLLHELALCERTFLRHLDNIHNLVLKPIVGADFYQSTVVNSMHSAPMNTLLHQYDDVTKLVSLIILDVTSCIQSRNKLRHIHFVRDYRQYVSVFAKYAQAYDDITAMAGHQYLAELAGPLLDRLYDVTADLCADEIDRGNHVTLLQHLFYTPLRHVKEYSRHLRKVALHYARDCEEHSSLTEAALLWDRLKEWMKQANVGAEQTARFWETCPVRCMEALRCPSRRLVRDCRQVSLALQNAGRFTTHHFFLFSDIFVHAQYSSYQAYPLETIWVEASVTEQGADEISHGLTLITPEDKVQLIAQGPAEKNDWFWTLNHAVDAVLARNKHHHGQSVRIGANIKPPLCRHAKHVYQKAGPYRGAAYTGMWLSGKPHGYGEMAWPDGKKYCGNFRQGQMNGAGVLVEPRGDEAMQAYDGAWQAGKRHGFGQLRYANGDVYDGLFRDGLRHGHGVLRTGSLKGREASLYIGEWQNDKRHGYGVLDDILKGEKYMCMWQDDQKHGYGVVVTLDGMYFEGNFTQNKISGTGLLLTEDNCCYEGEFQQGMTLSGKGVLTLVNGDLIEGTFHGALADGVRVNGVFRKSSSLPADQQQHPGYIHRNFAPRNFGRLCVPADSKWRDIFSATEVALQCSSGAADTNKAWEQVAILVWAGKKANAEQEKPVLMSRGDEEDLEKVPPHNQAHLTVEDYRRIVTYLRKSFSVSYHPLGKLMEDLVDVFRATYVGIGAHARLLRHAVVELDSYIKRVYRIIRVLFPELPEQDLPVEIYPRDHQPPITALDTVRHVQPEEDDGSLVITATGMLYTFMLPRVYPPLFTLYALYNERDDDRYWERVQRLNRQTDLALMAYLTVDQRFWHFDKTTSANEQVLSLSRDLVYREAVEALQQISTAFCPADKLDTIRRTFRQLNMCVEHQLGADYLWSMDELFPVFQYVVIRARIRHLGAEIHFVDDLMETHLEIGELGIMFTTLKASYFQVQNEKIVL